ncbi:hypothetical protein SDRG_03596 [Saprolegnia diclina VS20]|uniref:Uncharacterized protein n=1 Tax=Saprolegnia diclina (strain VS20) TaxID=1156394 RepID=T0QMS3_SAPDV|nr:hypothetical protein SDRG_03596 [Saprolegnia diclina VS20]EQC39394.1 hypothetical protein SDRG_03596 [Saprolegnia diclina VS20]|eukprot:XP_008607455.1 hypothetical protein SDRG_03596 [Saprolegnia diclina VS20]
MPPSDAKAAYEAVATQLKTLRLTTAVDTFELPYRVAPRLYVDTLRKALAWPLAVHEVDQLAVAYTLSPGVVLLPAMSVRVDNTNAWRKTLARVETVVRDVLSPTSPFRLALAHVAFDATGSSACLTPALRPPHTIGTVVISLPTFHGGGDVMFADGRSYCTQHATTTHVCAVFAPNANYLIEPMTYGRRVTLVYHVVAATDPVKANIDAATATLQSLAAAPSHALNVFALRPTAPTSPGVEGLAPDDRAFADALVETDVYDVALINKAHPGRPAEGRKVSATTVGVALPHGNSLCHVTVDAILFTDAGVDVRCIPGRWLYNRLPDPIVALVSSYLTPAVRLLDVTDGVLYHPLYDLGVALGILAAQNVAMDLLPYAARVIYAVMLDDYDGDDVRYSVEAVVGLVVAGDCANILESVLSRCLHDRGIAVVPALVAFARQCPRLVTPAFCAMASATILDATCSNRPVRPVMDDVLAAYFDANERCAGHDTRMLVLVCALEYFRTYDRATVLVFVDMWLAGNGDLNLHYEWTMYLTSTLSVDDGDVLVRLGLAYIEVTPYCPKVYTDYCLDDVAFAPTCCAYCVEFGRFLLSPVDAYRRCYAHQVCDAISDVVAAHPLQLQATTLRGLEILGEIALDTDGTGYALADPAIVIDFVKVRQPGQLSLRELCLRLEHLDTTTTSTMRRRRRMEELVTRTRAALAHRRETFVG